MVKSNSSPKVLRWYEKLDQADVDDAFDEATADCDSDDEIVSGLTSDGQPVVSNTTARCG